MTVSTQERFESHTKKFCELPGIGAALLSESSIERAMQTAHDVKNSINRLARAI